MADKKISQLTGATTPLAGTEVLPIVQSGSTVKVAVSNLTAGRSVSASSVGIGTVSIRSGYVLDVRESANNGVNIQAGDASTDIALSVGSAGTPDKFTVLSGGNVSIANGNLIVGTAGKGIDFSANSGAAGKSSQLLDDYEEGTWTPVVYGTTTEGTATYTTQKGNYVKVGNLVWAAGRVTYTGHTGTGDMRIKDLPFNATSINTLEPVVTIYGSNIAMTAGNYMVATQRFSAAYIEILQAPTGGGGETAVPMDAAGSLFFTVVYRSS